MIPHRLNYSFTDNLTYTESLGLVFYDTVPTEDVI
jgi:hypothetical protein